MLEWTACVNGDRLVLCYLQDVKVCVSAGVRVRACVRACVHVSELCVHVYMHAVQAFDSLCGNQVCT